MRHLIHTKSQSSEKIDLTELGFASLPKEKLESNQPTNLIDLPTLPDINPVYFSARQVDFSSVVHRNFLFCANFSINFNS